MSVLEDIEREPHRHDFYSVVRMLERELSHLPRVGDASNLQGELVRLSQDPYFAFPSSNLVGFARKDQGWQMKVRFLGQFGPQGALPLGVSEEVHGWLMRRDESFPRFVDIVTNRYLQLFYRAWANSRPIAQHDRPDQDRFSTYVGAHIGIASNALAGLDSVDDSRKLAFAGVIGAKAKSAARLRGFLQGLFNVKVEIDEFVGTQLKLEAHDCSRIGKSLSRLGHDLFMGSSVFSVQDKIRIRIFARDLEQYLEFLPQGRRFDELTDAVYFYVGEEIDWDVELALPTRDVVGTSLAARGGEAPETEDGKSTDRRETPPGLGMLGWTSWLSPNWAATDSYRCDARFHPAEISRARPNSRQKKH